MKGVFCLMAAMATMPLVAANPASWTEPVEPFRIIGNVYYIGTADLSSFLITTSEGHILLDAPMEENVPHLLRSIKSIGIDPREIGIMINSHAHFDHAGGFARMKEETGARLLISEKDAALLERGGRNDFAFGDRAVFTPVEVDGFVNDEDVIDLGGVELRAIATPGHTMGGTSWMMNVEENGRSYRVLFANSMSAPDYILVDNEKYPSIMSDYRASFDRLEEIEADVFLSTHGSFFRLRQKLDAWTEKEKNPFIDPEESKRFVERWRRIIDEQYAAQSRAE